MKLLPTLVVLALIAVAVIVYLKRKAAQAPELSLAEPQEYAEPEITAGPELTAEPELTVEPEISTVAEIVETPVALSTVETETVSVELVEAAPAPSAPVAKADWLPEDSALKRHYLSTRQAERLAITHPDPTDSALKRHALSQSLSLLAIASAATVVAESSPVIQPEAENLVEEPVIVTAQPNLQQTAGIPEDSMLRRHYLTQLQAQ